MSGYKSIFKSKLTETSTTASDLGTLGEYRIDEAGSIYKLVSTGASVIDGGLCQYDSVSGTDGYTVEPCYSTTLPGACVNNQGRTLAAGLACFLLVRGPGYCDLGENLTANFVLSPSTGGLVRNYDLATTIQGIVGRSIVSVASSAALTAMASASQVYFNCE